MRKNDPSIQPVVITGFSSVIVQCVFIRELLTLFLGNELILGIILSLWLFFNGLGNFYGNKRGVCNSLAWTMVLMIMIIIALFTIRFSPRLFNPGATLPLWTLASLGILVEGPFSFFTGYVFGTLAKSFPQEKSIYGLENLGALFGAILVYGATLLNFTNALILTPALIALPLIILLDKRLESPRRFYITLFSSLTAFSLVFLLIVLDFETASLKYVDKVDRIRYSREGEIALMVFSGDSTVLLNNRVYKSTINISLSEQSVHIAAAQRSIFNKALIIFDKNYLSELRKYDNIQIDIIETIPELAHPSSQIISPERFNSSSPYDLVILGTSPPVTTSACRFYTQSFFQKIQKLMTPHGILTFTLAFNENYMQDQERQLFMIILGTLQSVFSNTLIFPGNGHATFMASDDTLHIPEKIRVPTDYLVPFTLPSLTRERVDQVNNLPSTPFVNKNTRPLALYFSLRDWMNTFGYSSAFLIIILFIILALVTFLLPRYVSVLSVATSGFTTGVYSIGLMILYQGTYGSLYAEISLLIMALSLGFVAGSRWTTMPHGDLLIGIYAFISLFFLSSLEQPPVILFFFCHFGIGFLGAAQFVSQKGVVQGTLNAADLLGGVFGMALTSTVLVPLYGILPVALGLFVIKALIAFLTVKVLT